MTASQPLLEVKRLVKQFPVGRARMLTAVNNVSFSIRKGETLALVGESGSGKTTVGRCVLRVLEPTAGSVSFDGHDITHLDSKELRPFRRRIQVVFQDPYDSLNPRMPVRRIVAEPLQEFLGFSREEETSKVGDLLEQVGLSASVAKQYPHNLTSGQQQRVAIARALALNPDVLVLDEPTSALDPIARENIIGLLSSLQQQLGTAFLFISHDLVTVRHISHTIAVMYLGEIVEEGPIEHVFDDPDHPYTRALLASAPSVERRLEGVSQVALSGEIPSPIDLPKGCFLASRCPFALDGCWDQRPELEPTTGRHGPRRSRCLRTTGHLPPIDDDDAGAERGRAEGFKRRSEVESSMSVAEEG